MPTGVYKRTNENLKAIRDFNKTKIGKKRPPFTEEWKRKIGEKSKGRHPVKEFKKGNPKPKNAYVFPKGEKHPRWKGGVSNISDKIRGSNEYKIWRRAVLERDKYICIWCYSKENLQVDHIKSFRDFPELRFAIDNGRTLCKHCHFTTDSYGGKSQRIPKGSPNLTPPGF